MAKIHRRNAPEKGLNNPDSHNGVVTHLEPDILGCEVKWALRSITTNKVNGGDRISAELFQILKDDAVKVLHSIYQQMWKTQQGCSTAKGQFSFQCQRKAMPKNAQTTTQLHSSHMLVSSVQFSSVTQSCPTLCDPMNCSTPGLPVHHQLPEFTQTHVHRFCNAIYPSHPLSSPFPPAPNPFQHQGLLQ